MLKKERNTLLSNLGKGSSKTINVMDANKELQNALKQIVDIDKNGHAIIIIGTDDKSGGGYVGNARFLSVSIASMMLRDSIYADIINDAVDHYNYLKEEK